MRTLVLFMVLVAVPSLADEPSVVSSADPPAASARGVGAWLGSAPQVRHLSAGGGVDLTHRVALEVGGWGVLDSTQPVFLRGGWVGAKFLVLDLPSLEMRARARVFIAQPTSTDSVTAGIAAEAHTTMHFLSWLTLVPGFEIAWLGPLTQGRLSAAYRFYSGAWTIDAIVGAQGWVRDETLTVAPMAEVLVDWHGRFDRVDVGIGGGLALARDGSFLVDHPLGLQPSDALQPWLFARVSVTPQFAW